MVKRAKPPSRQRYEATHPSLTVRVPAAVKGRVIELSRAQGLPVSEWVQATAACHVADPAEAYRRGHEAGRREGDSAGYARGRSEGVTSGGQAGFRAGLLAASFAGAHGRSYHPPTVARPLAQDPLQKAIAERLIPGAYRSDWFRLLRSIGSGER